MLYFYLSFIIYRCKKVYDGVTHAGKLYPNAYLIMILIGTLKGKLYYYKIRNERLSIEKFIRVIYSCSFTGNGAGFLKLFERLTRGVWTPTAMELMQPSL